MTTTPTGSSTAPTQGSGAAGAATFDDNGAQISRLDALAGRTSDRKTDSPLKQVSPGPKTAKNKTAISAALCALFIFAAVNTYLSYSPAIKFDQYKYTSRGWPWWILNDLRQYPVPHNVVLLGSSLMVSAVAGCDAKYLNRDLDQTTYHDAAYVDHVLGTTFGGKFKTFDLAIPGQMPSDAYMALQAALNLGQHPQAIIYGIAPRDFIDSTLLSPLDTETYHYLSRIVDLEPLAPQFFKDPQTKLNRILEKSVFLYGHSLDLGIAANDTVSPIMQTLVPTPKGGRPFTYWDRIKLLPNYKKGELYPTAMIASPLEQTFSLSRFTDNTKDYIERYKHSRPETFRMQMFFMQKLAQLCSANHIGLIVVNMPITRKNISLLGDQRYGQYLKDINQFGQVNAVPVLDLNDFNKYSIEDFHDLVHLNGSGATKFFDSLAVSLGRNPSTDQLCKRISQARQ